MELDETTVAALLRQELRAYEGVIEDDLFRALQDPAYRRSLEVSLRVMADGGAGLESTAKRCLRLSIWHVVRLFSDYGGIHVIQMASLALRAWTLQKKFSVLRIKALRRVAGLGVLVDGYQDLGKHARNVLEQVRVWFILSLELRDAELLVSARVMDLMSSSLRVPVPCIMGSYDREGQLWRGLPPRHQRSSFRTRRPVGADTRPSHSIVWLIILRASHRRSV